MALIRFVLIGIYFYSLSVNASSVQLFGSTIEIPEKYRVITKASIGKGKLVFRTGSFTNGAKNGLLEIITIGMTEELMKGESIDNFTGAFGAENSFYELKSPLECIQIGDHCYINRVYFDQNYYISYSVLNVDDIDAIFLNKELKEH